MTLLLCGGGWAGLRSRRGASLSPPSPYLLIPLDEECLHCLIQQRHIERLAEVEQTLHGGGVGVECAGDGWLVCAAGGAWTTGGGRRLAVAETSGGGWRWWELGWQRCLVERQTAGGGGVTEQRVDESPINPSISRLAGWRIAVESGQRIEAHTKGEQSQPSPNHSHPAPSALRQPDACTRVAQLHATTVGVRRDGRSGSIAETLGPAFLFFFFFLCEWQCSGSGSLRRRRSRLESVLRY